MFLDKIEIIVLEEITTSVEGTYLKVLLKYNGKQYTYFHKGKDGSKKDILEELLLTESKLKSGIYRKLFKGSLYKDKEESELKKLSHIKRLFGNDYNEIIKEFI